MEVFKKMLHSRRGVAVELLTGFLVLFLVGIIWIGLGTAFVDMYGWWATSVSTPDVNSSVQIYYQFFMYFGFFIFLAVLFMVIVQSQRQENPYGY